ncbi:MAG: c-type cytochrome [Thiobacillus sp.]|nr:c-type cytochrome [Thiobacillus sp.]MDP2979052.1 c-type cytochrome [Thiobacillus sp.]
MADSNVKTTPTKPREVIVSIVAGLLAPLLAIFLIVQLVLGIQAGQKPDTSSEAAQKAALERIKPYAELAALDASAPVVEKSGQEVYDAACVACHGSGALDAPRFENKGDWNARIGQGYDTLVKNAIEGIRQMPPRGGNADLTDAEVARAVVYMANASGASFKAPEAAAPAEEKAAPAAAAGAVKPDLAMGKKVYQTSCALCHAAGIAGAPKPGDMAAWEPRVAQGYTTLYDHAITGIRGMPPKGGNPGLSEADIANAVGYMFSESGGKL